MKKNLMMRAASVLLVAVMLTTCAISGTFAKYVTSDSNEDSARVAKWGVTVLASGSLYGTKYAAADSKITASEEPGVVSVWGKQMTTGADPLNDVVAPGTQSDKGLHFGITGKPEVDALVTMSIEHQNIFLAEGEYGVMVKVSDVTQDNFVANKYYTKDSTTYTKVADWATASSKLDNLYELHDAATVGAGGYWPVVYTMTGDTNATGDTTADSLKVVADAIADRISTDAPTQNSTNKSQWTYTNITKAIEQNTDLTATDSVNLDAIEISWAWAFDGINDGADTILGNLMAKRIGTNFDGEVVMYVDASTYTNALVEGTHYCLDTNFSINIMVEQTN